MVRLHDGAEIPWIGYGSGTAHIATDCTSITLAAIQNGFTHIDCAQSYRNEQSVGPALTQTISAKGRPYLFVTTKLSKVEQGESVECKLHESLSKLGLEYVDLFLIHNSNLHEDVGIVQVWKEMMEVKKLGLTKSIGVSNFNRAQIQELLDAGLELPAVNQIEYHAFLAHTLQPLLDFHAKLGIRTQSYGGLTPLINSRFEKVTDVALKERREALVQLMESIAAKHNMTTSQAMLKWLKARGLIAITTSTKEERIKEYLAADGLPDRDADEVNQITDVAGEVQYRSFTWAPHMDVQ